MPPRFPKPLLVLLVLPAMIGSLLLSNTAERLFDRARTRRLLAAGPTLDQPSTSGSS